MNSIIIAFESIPIEGPRFNKCTQARVIVLRCADNRSKIAYPHADPESCNPRGPGKHRHPKTKDLYNIHSKRGWKDQRCPKSP